MAPTVCVCITVSFNCVYLCLFNKPVAAKAGLKAASVLLCGLSRHIGC